MPREITGSFLPIAMKCAAAGALPAVDDISPFEPRDRGVAIHDFLQAVSERGRDAALAEAEQKYDASMVATLRAIDVEALPTHLASEVALAWDWRARATRELGRGIKRQYGKLAPTEIPFTLDLAGVDTSGFSPRVFVADYKSGFSWLPRPKDHEQVMMGGVALAKLHDADEAVLSLIKPDSFAPLHLTDTIDQATIESFADRVEAQMDRVDFARRQVAAGQQPDVVLGPHCRYCPAWKACHGQTGLIRRVAENTMPSRLDDPVTPEQAVVAFELLERAKALTHRLEWELEQYLSREPAPLPDGRMLGLVESVKEFLDGKVAYQVVSRSYDRKAIDDAFKMSTSKTALRKMIATRIHTMQAANGKKARISTKDGTGALDRLLSDIRDAGGIAEKRSYKIDRALPSKIVRGAALVSRDAPSLPEAEAAEADSGGDDDYSEWGI